MIPNYWDNFLEGILRARGIVMATKDVKDILPTAKRYSGVCSISTAIPEPIEKALHDVVLNLYKEVIEDNATIVLAHTYISHGEDQITVGVKLFGELP